MSMPVLTTVSYPSTADGETVLVGMTIYVSTSEDRIPIKRTVGSIISQFKILYKEEEQTDTRIGAKLTSCFACPENAMGAMLEKRGMSPFTSLAIKIQADPEYAWAMQCNIAIPIFDSLGLSHEQSNIAAAHIMHNLWSVDVKTHPAWKSFEADWQADKTPPNTHGGTTEEIANGG